MCLVSVLHVASTEVLERVCVVCSVLHQWQSETRGSRGSECVVCGRASGQCFTCGMYKFYIRVKQGARVCVFGMQPSIWSVVVSQW